MPFENAIQAHGAASFLSWHRYFIHLYEKTLKEDCGYRGHLAYWDWSLDWENLSKSPVWDNDTGFGGDGDPKGTETVGFGRCVADGPFKDLRPLFYNNDDNPHCLSRGFWDGQKEGFLSGSGISPQAIEQIMALPDYESFFLALEHGPHNVIPNSVRGDFFEVHCPLRSSIFPPSHPARQTMVAVANEEPITENDGVHWQLKPQFCSASKVE